ncbi:MAG: hypothetical protein ACI9K2_006548 [Myxococcota bacterium]|jgi:hypothetical protein
MDPNAEPVIARPGGVLRCALRARAASDARRPQPVRGGAGRCGPSGVSALAPDAGAQRRRPCGRVAGPAGPGGGGRGRSSPVAVGAGGATPPPVGGALRGVGGARGRERSRRRPPRAGAVGALHRPGGGVAPAPVRRRRGPGVHPVQAAVAQRPDGRPAPARGVRAQAREPAPAARGESGAVLRGVCAGLTATPSRRAPAPGRRHLAPRRTLDRVASLDAVHVRRRSDPVFTVWAGDANGGHAARPRTGVHRPALAGARCPRAPEVGGVRGAVRGRDSAARG